METCPRRAPRNNWRDSHRSSIITFILKHMRIIEGIFYQNPELRGGGLSKTAEGAATESEIQTNFVKDLYGSHNLFGHWNSVRVAHRFIQDHRDSSRGRKAIIDAIVDGYPSESELHDQFTIASDKGLIAGYRRHEADPQEEGILHTIEEQLGRSFLGLSVDMMRGIDKDANTLKDVRREDLVDEVDDLRRLTELSAELLWKHRFSRVHARNSEHHLCEDLHLTREIILGLRKTDGRFETAQRCYQKTKQLYGTWIASHHNRDRLHMTEAYRLMEELNKLMAS